MSDTTHTAHDLTHTEPKRLSAGSYVATFIVLFLILAVFADLLVFIVGTIGLIVIFAALYSESAAHDTNH